MPNTSPTAALAALICATPSCPLDHADGTYCYRGHDLATALANAGVGFLNEVEQERDALAEVAAEANEREKALEVALADVQQRLRKRLKSGKQPRAGTVYDDNYAGGYRTALQAALNIVTAALNPAPDAGPRQTQQVNLGNPKLRHLEAAERILDESSDWISYTEPARG